jgi:hypothetical protein
MKSEFVTYKRIKGSHHLISSEGELFTMYRNKFSPMKTLNCKGYERVSIYLNGKRKGKFIHLLVAEHFLTKKKHLKEVNHKDRNKFNNKVSNLEWCSKRQNITHFATEDGNKRIGALFHPSKKYKKWQSRIQYKGKIISLKYWHTKYEAEEAYRKKYLELFKIEPWVVKNV